MDIKHRDDCDVVSTGELMLDHFKIWEHDIPLEVLVFGQLLSKLVYASCGEARGDANGNSVNIIIDRELAHSKHTYNAKNTATDTNNQRNPLVIKRNPLDYVEA